MDMTWRCGIRGFKRGFRLVGAVLVFAGSLFWAGLGTSIAADDDSPNLLVNSELKSEGSNVPTNWKVAALPDCGFSFILRKSSDGNSGELELINNDTAESSVEQDVHLKPGWYRFSVEIKTELLGSAGASPELFAKSLTLPVQIRRHSIGWSSGWQKLQFFFKTGPRLPDIAVGCSLGGWGSPNSGKMLVRNPILTATSKPKATKRIEVVEDFDLEKIAASRFGPPEAEEGFYAAKYPPGRHWTVAAAYIGFLLIAILGWYAVSPRRVNQPMP